MNVVDLLPIFFLIRTVWSSLNPREVGGGGGVYPIKATERETKIEPSKNVRNA